MLLLFTYDHLANPGEKHTLPTQTKSYMKQNIWEQLMEYMYQKPKVWLDIDVSILICIENAPDVWSVSLYKKTY